jgi:hypothetical protein
MAFPENDFKIELVFDMFSVYSKLQNNPKYSCSSDKYMRFYQKNNPQKEHIRQKIKSIWPNRMVRTFVLNLNALIDDAGDSVNTEELLQKSLEFLKNEFSDCDDLITQNNLYSQINMFVYLTGKTIRECIDEMIWNPEIIEIFRKMIVYRITSPTMDCSFGNYFAEIYSKIENYTESYMRFNNNSEIYFSYLIPKDIIFKDVYGKISDKYSVSNIIGVGSYGCVVQYVQSDISDPSINPPKSICLKIYLTDNYEKEILEKINQFPELSNIIINSLYLEEYDMTLENSLLETRYQDHNSSSKKMHYLIMECETPIDKKFIDINKKNKKLNISIMCNIIEKVIRLINHDIYFTDLKLANILFLNDINDVRFIDLDSFYFLERGNRVVFSYTDLITHLIPMKNKKTHITLENINALEKVIVFKLSILTLELFGYNIDIMRKFNFQIDWIDFVDSNFMKYTKHENRCILKSMFSLDSKKIPSLNSVFLAFSDINNNII